MAHRQPRLLDLLKTLPQRQETLPLATGVGPRHLKLLDGLAKIPQPLVGQAQEVLESHVVGIALATELVDLQVQQLELLAEFLVHQGRLLVAGVVLVLGLTNLELQAADPGVVQPLLDVGIAVRQFQGLGQYFHGLLETLFSKVHLPQFHVQRQLLGGLLDLLQQPLFRGDLDLRVAAAT